MQIKNLHLYIKLAWFYTASFFGAKKARFLSAEETVNYIRKNNVSFIRFGDGEFDILEGKSIHYQEYSKELALSLNKIVTEYMSNDESSAYFIAMPGLYLRNNGLFLLRKKVLLSSWGHTRYFFKKWYDENHIFGDAFLFGQNNEAIYEALWKNTEIESVIFVHNAEKYAVQFERKYKIQTLFVPIPPKNAFDHRNEILHRIQAHIISNIRQLVLVSAGPCGKILVYELSKRGIQAIDTGHCWDSPLESEIN